ncbi:hypothetical protein LSH36_142g07041 [Paralvinella palmiformis]|uniref:Uncharacterized protein n=1 Tax=Paralvinella palmiformis TaxID=53620 RepID=A0AAD9JVB6_9ANNE|nr:hypothetical protein LSH36_142g07041 [Paralvinella palmiformis]
MPKKAGKTKSLSCLKTGLGGIFRRKSKTIIVEGTDDNSQIEIHKVGSERFDPEAKDKIHVCSTLNSEGEVVQELNTEDTEAAVCSNSVDNTLADKISLWKGDIETLQIDVIEHNSDKIDILSVQKPFAYYTLEDVGKFCQMRLKILLDLELKTIVRL